MGCERIDQVGFSRPFIPVKSLAASENQVNLSMNCDAVFIGIIELKRWFVIFFGLTEPANLSILAVLKTQRASSSGGRAAAF